MVMINPKPQQEDKPSRLLVEFEGFGSAMFNIRFENVAPVQLIALAGYLEAMAKADLLEQRELQKVQVPRMQGNPDLDGLLK